MRSPIFESFKRDHFPFIDLFLFHICIFLLRSKANRVVWHLQGAANWYRKGRIPFMAKGSFPGRAAMHHIQLDNYALKIKIETKMGWNREPFKGPTIGAYNIITTIHHVFAGKVILTRSCHFVGQNRAAQRKQRPAAPHHSSDDVGSTSKWIGRPIYKHGTASAHDPVTALNIDHPFPLPPFEITIDMDLSLCAHTVQSNTNQ